jgi:hypothetical protein
MDVTEGGQPRKATAAVIDFGEAEHGADATTALSAVSPRVPRPLLPLAGAVRVVALGACLWASGVLLGHCHVRPQHAGEAGSRDLRHPRRRVADDGVVHPAEACASCADVNRVYGHAGVGRRRFRLSARSGARARARRSCEGAGGPASGRKRLRRWDSKPARPPDPRPTWHRTPRDPLRTESPRSAMPAPCLPTSLFAFQS